MLFLRAGCLDTIWLKYHRRILHVKSESVFEGRIRVIAIRIHNPAIQAERGEPQKRIKEFIITAAAGSEQFNKVLPGRKKT